MKFGLLGRKLGHSYSPEIHSHLGSTPYSLYEVEPEQLESFLKQGDFTGINVTMPYKKDVIPFLNSLSDTAGKLGAVNTIVRTSDGKLLGHNTDYYGFSYLLHRITPTPAGKKILVLGSGGASNTVVAVLREEGAIPVIISRNGENNYENLHLHTDADAIVNTTPVGMYPNTGVSPVDLTQFPHLSWVLDIVYNPAKTQLLLDAEKLGIPSENGLRMLVAQAKESAEWFLQKKLEDSLIETVYKTLSVKMKNIILIGMPGSGKSTVAAALSETLGREYRDTDQRITELACRSIPKIFEQEKEAGFRKLETRAIAEISKQSGLIIATGGGCVTVPENIPLLRQNGILFWLHRDLDKLPTNGRPLSQNHPLSQLYEKRVPLYQAAADYSISNNGSLEDTLAQILNILEKEL